jgi:hypothetical protein
MFTFLNLRALKSGAGQKYSTVILTVRQKTLQAINDAITAAAEDGKIKVWR